MNRELEDLRFAVKRRFSYRFKPQFSENFKTSINDSHIIPLIEEVFNQLDWQVVFTDKRSVEAKGKNDWNKLTSKLTVTKKSSGRIEVHSKSLKGLFTDLGKNSKRTGLFIALFKKLEEDYASNGKLEELEEAFNKTYNWVDYEIPTTLPPPPKTIQPNLNLTIIGGLIIAIISGFILGFLTQNFGHVIGIYELALGLFVGYFFGLVLTKTNYTAHNPTKYILIVILITTLFVSLLTEHLINSQSIHNSNQGFSEYLKLRLERGLVIEQMESGWIGLVIAWSFQIWFSYIIALFKVTQTTLKFVINRIPVEVLAFTIYHLENGSSIKQVRYHLAQKGWESTQDQDNIFEALNDIFGLQEYRRNS